ncbi:hypothetical protein ACTXT7_011262 [Hymenolepis weldensis]
MNTAVRYFTFRDSKHDLFHRLHQVLVHDVRVAVLTEKVPLRNLVALLQKCGLNIWAMPAWAACYENENEDVVWMKNPNKKSIPLLLEPDAQIKGVSEREVVCVELGVADFSKTRAR